jgi:excisionase family DNA binding protein
MHKTLPDKTARVQALLSAEEVAEHFGVSKTTIYRLVRDGLFLCPERLGRRLRRWNVAKLNDWIDRGCPGLCDGV